MQPTRMQLSLNQAKADPIIAWARLAIAVKWDYYMHLYLYACITVKLYLISKCSCKKAVPATML